MVEFNGHFDGTVITPDEQVELPVNIPLRITVEPAAERKPQQVDWKRLAELAVKYSIEGPKDLAENHDHYAHGKPRE
jgi:hypothetical protein